MRFTSEQYPKMFRLILAAYRLKHSGYYASIVLLLALVACIAAIAVLRRKARRSVAQYELIRTFKAHKVPILSVAISPQGALLASAGKRPDKAKITRFSQQSDR
jgi:hypothetical protein